jgi:hypothetical protein
MVQKRKGGEGNREADRQYRKGVKRTVERTSGDERKRKARDLTPEELEDARMAEERAKSRSRK